MMTWRIIPSANLGGTKFAAINVGSHLVPQAPPQYNGFAKEERERERKLTLAKLPDSVYPYAQQVGPYPSHPLAPRWLAHCFTFTEQQNPLPPPPSTDVMRRTRRPPDHSPFFPSSYFITLLRPLTHTRTVQLDGKSRNPRLLHKNSSSRTSSYLFLCPARESLLPINHHRRSSCLRAPPPSISYGGGGFFEFPASPDRIAILIGSLSRFFFSSLVSLPSLHREIPLSDPSRCYWVR